MMMKYRVREVAKDLDIPNKEVLDTLAKYFPEPKKYMTALEENELDVVFEAFTQERNMENLDAYFAQREKPKAAPVVTVEEEPQAAPAPAAQEQPRQEKKPQQHQNQGKQGGEKHQGQQQKGAPQQKPAQPQQPQAAAKPAAPVQVQEPKQPVRRVVDTRSSNVNIDRYNEKYDRLADQKVKTDNMVNKQKFTNRNQQRRGQQRKGKRETEAQRLQRIAQERKAKHITIEVPEEITVGEFALRLKVSAPEVIKKLMALGVFATINDTIDFDTAVLVADEFHAKVEKEVVVTIEERIIDDSEDEEENLVPRAPVVVVMGHVDHGKTSLLDYIRNSQVAEGEAGGITQHIGAYQVEVNGSPITFLDTPGHEAFTAMRARGAMITDIAILVVAADDGIMPQTIESINHAKAAEIPVIVAINKMDKPEANPERVKQQLTEYGLVPEEWGGETICCPISAKTGLGIDNLLEMVVLTAEMRELKANPNRSAHGAVIEARLDKGRGPIATLLVQNGTLHQGDVIIAGTAVGRVRAMTNAKGQKIQTAGPSVPVEITGMGEVPGAGDDFHAVDDERMARELVEQRKHEHKMAASAATQKVTLDDLFSQIQQGELKDLNIIVKADVQGSAEAVKASLEKLTNEEVRVRVIHCAVGAINESDVMLATTSNAIIVGFNVRPDANAKDTAARNKVDMRMYRVIYDCINEMEAAMKGMLAPKFKEVALGTAEVREVYKITGVGIVAGCYITDGKVQRNAQVRLVRDGIVIHEGVLSSLQRFKDAVKEVAQGYECGIGIEKYSDIKVGDLIEAFVMEQIEV